MKERVWSQILSTYTNPNVKTLPLLSANGYTNLGNNDAGSLSLLFISWGPWVS